MTNENKIASMDAVGELPDFGNLLLREGGYPHLDDTPKQSQSDAWNDAATRPSEKGIYKTRINSDDSLPAYQMWNGEYWDLPGETVEEASRVIRKSCMQNIQWREVQP